MKIITDKELLKHKGLWHGVKFKNTMNIFNKNCIEARTTQRYWKEGQFFFDDQRTEYEKSFFLKGWSTTRSKFYAMSWGEVVFLLDEEKIKRDFEVKPFAWNATIRHAFDFKKETEEFIVSNRMNKTFEELKDEFHDKLDMLYEDDNQSEIDHFLEVTCSGQDFIGYFKQSGDRSISLSAYVKGFFICDHKPIANDLDDADYLFLTEHPLFLGFYEQQKAKHLSKKTEKTKNYN